MGAEQFFEVGVGATAEAAFKHRRNQDLYAYGHAGYTGTLAEKDSFRILQVPKDELPREFAVRYLDKETIADVDGPEEESIHSKWGPAGCVRLSENSWLFFGWAST